jgi:hypothetical protein
MDVAQVRKVKTAFLFYQADQLSKIRAELGLSMGDAMTHVRNPLLLYRATLLPVFRVEC